MVHSTDHGPKINVWLNEDETPYVFDPQDQLYPKSIEELRKCLVSRKDYADSIEPSLRIDQGLQGYINGDLSYNTGVKYPLTLLNAPLVKEAHDKLINIFREQANKPVQRGKVLGEKHSSGSNEEPIGKRGGFSHLAAKSMNGPPPNGRGRGRGAGPETGSRGRGTSAAAGQGRGGQKGYVTFSL